ncbi:hypothetical protein AURANDRAFT_62417 [Aureococcus anophagefferens]|uniref:Uncharacterized protein n=1 Tax=Aureococcus anophagefferens TaxID=44056 RepID=F0Y1T2_AURAN|nr:hypothetical protein AURANDRAFT_62417 [Aureococcus anophagefferens]EGB10879.1 hypothetical protein AURANDRAFT_62417 [Aureococcus anophagefferens]|eukprot:XP_009034456.1 hypothetical protein AURANDRAFT_62417 [Aureococcus anophagefferens]
MAGAGPTFCVHTVTATGAPSSVAPTALSALDAFEARFGGPHMCYEFDAPLDPARLERGFAKLLRECPWLGGAVAPLPGDPPAALAIVGAPAAAAEAHFAAVGLGRAARVAAVDGRSLAWDPARHGPRRPWWNEAALGCLRSQRRALRDAAARGDGALLLLEDDAILDANVVAKVRAWTAHRAFARVPWHLLYLGGNHDLPPAELSDDDDDDDDDGGGGAPCRLVRARRTVALHAVLVHRRAFAGAGVLALLDTEAAPSDILLARDYQPRFPCFVLEPRLATQRRGHSDIRGEIVDYAALLGGAPTGDT